MVVVNARYFPHMRIHVLEGYSTEKVYVNAYNDVIATVASKTEAYTIESITLTKCIVSNETGLNFAGYHVIVQYKE